MMIVAVFCLYSVDRVRLTLPLFPFRRTPRQAQSPFRLVGVDGEAVRKALGNPLVASRYWGIERFRDASSQTETTYGIISSPFAI